MRFLVIVCCVLLGGCVAYRPRPLDAARMAARFEARSLAAPGLRAYLARASGQPPAPWPAVRWNRRMLTLAAGYYSPALAVARARRQGAQAGIDAALARPNPVLEFPFEYELNHQGPGKPYTTGPLLAWTIETGGKRAARVDAAAATAAAAQCELVDAAWRVRSQVRAALLGVFAQTRRQALLADKAGDQRRGVALLAERLGAGAIALPDLRRARLELARTESDLAAAQVALADARARLATAVGVPLAALDGIELDVGEFEHALAAPAPADARRAAILRRADLHAALAEYEAGQAALRQQIARQYPDVRLGAGYSYDVGANKISFGLAGVTLPVFDRNRGPIAQAEARRSELAARAQALQAAIFNDVDNALARWRAGAQQAARAARQAAMAARQRDSVDARFAAGAADRLALTQARADFAGFALQRLDAVVAQQQAAGLLEDAMQQPLAAAPPAPHTDPQPSSP